MVRKTSPPTKKTPKRLSELVIALALGTSNAIAFSSPTFAQIVPDGTLGNQNSTPDIPANAAGTFQINGGATRGTNLFHSFDQFNVNQGQLVYFTNPAGIQNILSRVTGSNASNILGTLGVGTPGAVGTANLFLINPNGIVFGPNARLDVGGSFVGTTANAIQFTDGSLFSATAPNTTPLPLTVNPNAFFFNQIAANASITNQSTVGLQVPSGKNLWLIGGNVNVQGGILRAPGGRIELGGLAESGTVKIVVDPNNPNKLKLDFPDSIARGDVTLTNGSIVDVVAGDGGDIAITARNIDISGGDTNVCAGIGASGSSCNSSGSDLGSSASQAGNIIFDGTGTVTIKQSRIENNLNPGATGNSGDIFDAIINRDKIFGSILIGGESVSVTDSAEVSTSSFGTGSAGVVFLTTKGGISVENSGIFSNMSSTQKGNAGGILLQAGSISLNSSKLQVQSDSTSGDAGIVSLQAEGGAISINNSTIFSDVRTGAVGNARGVVIKGRSVSLTDSAASSSTYGQGNAGEVRFTVDDSLKLVRSNIFSNVESGGKGSGGNIEIATGSLSLSDGSQLQTLIRGPSGVGDAGVVFVNARDSVSLTGSRTAIFSTIEEGAQGNTASNQFAGNLFGALGGNGGDVTGSIIILTGSLSLTEGAALTASTRGLGNAGAVLVFARDDISFKNNSGILSAVYPTAKGNAGGIIVIGGSFEAINGSGLTTQTNGQGDAGLILVKTDGDISIGGIDSGILSSVESGRSNSAGAILLNSRTLYIRDGAKVSVNNQGTGVAGAVIINARDLRLEKQGQLTAVTLSGQGGDIDLRGVREILLLTRDSGISTTAGSDFFGGDGGNIKINTNFIFAAPVNNSDIRANAYTGTGGKITVNSIQLFSIDPGKLPTNDIDASSELGIDGLTQVNSVDPYFDLGGNRPPADLVDPSQLIAQRCAARSRTTGKENKFTVTGRGGIRSSPNDTLQNESVITDWVTLDPQVENPTTGKPTSAQPQDSTLVATQTPKTKAYIEAQGWVINEKGEIMLTAKASTITPHNPTLIPVDTCNGS